MDRGEYLLEVRTEEIPARMLQPAIRELGAGLFTALEKLGLAPREVDTGFTPRRLVVFVRDLPLQEADREEEILGPPARVAFAEDGSPTPALAGFARKLGVEPEALERKSTEKGEYVALRRTTPGRPTAEILGELVPRHLERVPWPKNMCWGRRVGPWVRPVHGIVSLLDDQLVPFELFGIAAGDTTAGHPILSPEGFRVTGGAHYLEQLTERGIRIRFEERRRTIWEEATRYAESLGGRPGQDDALLDKLASICEIPGVSAGTFDPRYLDLPREVLVASLRDHQSALTVEDERGDLLPSFLTVMDRPDDEHGFVRSGNEWVVAARLEDARFFYEEDRKQSLEEQHQRLERLTFHVRLGSYAEKSERLVKLAGLLCDELGWIDEREPAQTAARLLKVDLTSDMVVEFTSLQGIMGGRYAEAEGYPEEVWQAIYDQYLPASAEDPIPRGRVGQIVALADRLDTLVGFFGLGQVPTGSKDPFGLRRAAQGVVKILLDGDLALDLDLVVPRAVRLFESPLDRRRHEVLADFQPFVADRVRHLLGRRGLAYDEIEAAMAVGGSDLPDLAARVAAVHEARTEKDFLDVVLAAKRIVNIVRDSPEHQIDPESLVEKAEKALFEAYSELRSEIELAAAERRYLDGLRQVSSFASTLDRFFVEVLVMDPDEKLRENRIALLQAIHRVISRIARLSEVVVEKNA